MTDETLFRLCKSYGEKARFWRAKFIGLLPEVQRRGLYEKKNFSSIFEFGKKLAGLSEEQVRLALNLERRFADKPHLKKLLVQGEASLNKLARVVSVATPENEEALAEKVKLLPQLALETLVRDERNGLNRPQVEAKTLRAQTLDFELSKEVIATLNDLNSKGHDVNSLLKGLLDERETKISEEKEKLGEEAPESRSRYIPAKVRRLLSEEHGSKCSLPNCLKPAQEIHHSQRFSLANTHDPRYLAPLCKEHHLIAHSIDQRLHEKRYRRQSH